MLLETKFCKIYIKTGFLFIDPLCAYVDHIYIYIYIYMLGLALITLLSLSPYVENSYKDFFGVNYFLIGAGGRIDFPG